MLLDRILQQSHEAIALGEEVAKALLEILLLEIDTVGLGVTDFEIRVIPKPKGIFDIFLGGSDDNEFAHMSTGLSLKLLELPLLRSLLPMIARVDPLRARAVVRTLLRIELINAEAAIMMMPEEILIR